MLCTKRGIYVGVATQETQWKLFENEYSIQGLCRSKGLIFFNDKHCQYQTTHFPQRNFLVCEVVQYHGVEAFVSQDFAVICSINLSINNYITLPCCPLLSVLQTPIIRNGSIATATHALSFSINQRIMFPRLSDMGTIHGEHNNCTEKQCKCMAMWSNDDLPGKGVGSGTGAGVIDAWNCRTFCLYHRDDHKLCFMAMYSHSCQHFLISLYLE